MAPPFRAAMSGSSDSIDHYSEISQKSADDDDVTRPMSYAGLDPRSVAEIANRPPTVYDKLAGE